MKHGARVRKSQPPPGVGPGDGLGVGLGDGDGDGLGLGFGVGPGDGVGVGLEPAKFAFNYYCIGIGKFDIWAARPIFRCSHGPLDFIALP